MLMLWVAYTFVCPVTTAVGKRVHGKCELSSLVHVYPRLGAHKEQTHNEGNDTCVLCEKGSIVGLNGLHRLHDPTLSTKEQQ